MGRIERWSDCVSEGASSGLDGAMRPSDWRKSCSQPILTPDLVNVDPPDYFTGQRVDPHGRACGVTPRRLRRPDHQGVTRAGSWLRRTTGIPASCIA